MNWLENNVLKKQLPWIVVFALLYAIWLVPGTLAIRYFCLIIGAVFGVYQFIKNKDLINLKNYGGILLIYALFAIVIFHYFQNDEASELIKREFSVIWKKVFLAVTFAIGLGLGLRGKKFFRYKNIYIISLLLPVVLFVIVYSINNYEILSSFSQLAVVNYFNPGRSDYISKYQYVFFAMPILGVTFYEFLIALEDRAKILKNLIILATLIFILISFYLFQGKNGFVYFMGGFMFLILRSIPKYYNSPKKLLWMLIFGISILLIARQHFAHEPAWQNLDADIQVALDTEKHDVWKRSQSTAVQNKYGQAVNESTYLRIAWLKEGLLMVIEYPLGYGLIENSFKYLGKKKWADSSLSHTHWGWIDLTLGLGITGLIITVVAVLNAFNKCRKSQNYYAQTGVWVLPLLSLAFLTSEVCEKTSWDMFLFMIAFYSTVSIEDA